jgi:hypothetical protein
MTYLLFTHYCVTIPMYVFGSCETLAFIIFTAVFFARHIGKMLR